MELVRISKQITANELGLTGSHQYGLLVPKSEAYLSFFPPLDSNKPNPSIEFEIEIRAIQSFRSVRFVYYNSKRLGTGTRDEFRLTKIIPVIKALGATEGDEVVFSKSPDGMIAIELTRANKFSDREFRGGWKLLEEGE